MKYNKTVILKNGKSCCLRNGTEWDGKTLCDVMIKTHGETDFLLSYPDEDDFTPDGEREYLKNKAESENEAEILAVVDGCVVGTAGIDSVGKKYKLRHRAEFGVCVLKEYWDFGIGSALTAACIECARKAGYAQLELAVMADNVKAVNMYRKAGFTEFGRNPMEFKSRVTGYQEAIYMRLEL